jgi:alkylation response protein AidB-like acyl-CoA dehydrogenase
MTATSASVRFGPDGVTGVESLIRLTGSTYIRCCVYDDGAPILTVKDAHVDISITVPGSDEVTADDVRSGRLLAGAVGQYVAELERRMPAGRADVAAGGDGAGQAA